MSSLEVDDDFLVSALDEIEQNDFEDNLDYKNIKYDDCTPPDFSILQKQNNYIKSASPTNHEDTSFTENNPVNIKKVSKISKDFSVKLKETLLKGQKRILTNTIKINKTADSDINNGLTEDDLNIFVDNKFGEIPPQKRKYGDFSHVDDTTINKAKKATKGDILEENTIISTNVGSNAAVVNTSNTDSHVTKRKFPGPAGLLPKLSNKTPLNLLKDMKTSDLFLPEEKENTLCSQSTANDFLSGSWKYMLLDMKDHEDLVNYISLRNIRSLIRRANFGNKTSIRKVPFLAVMVRSLDQTYNEATGVFQDESGSISGELNDIVMEKFVDFIIPGSTLLLKDVTLLSPLFQGINIIRQTKKHFLNVSLKSIVTIYTPVEDRILKTEVFKLNQNVISDLLATSERKYEKIEIVETEEEENVGNRDFLFESIGNSNGEGTSGNNRYPITSPGVRYNKSNKYVGKYQHTPKFNNNNVRKPNFNSPRFKSPISTKARSSFSSPQPSPSVTNTCTDNKKFSFIKVKNKSEETCLVNNTPVCKNNNKFAKNVVTSNQSLMDDGYEDEIDSILSTIDTNCF